MKLFRAGNPHMFWLFLISWSAVHLGFEWEFWLGGGAGVFGKYQVTDDPTELVTIAQKVYYTKATWMFALVWLQVLGLPLRSAVAWSFLVYGIQLLLFFPVQIYSVLNVLLALGCVGEDLILRRRENGRHRRAG
jgi:hypothetical protein